MNINPVYLILLVVVSNRAFSMTHISLNPEELTAQFLKAAKEGLLPLMTDLLKKGAEINSYDSKKYTGLHWAAKNNLHDCLIILINAGADVNARTLNAETALHLAAENGNRDCIDILLKSGTDCNEKDINEATALQAAAFYGHMDCVKALIEAGAGINDADVQGLTALHCAAMSGHHECLKIIIESGAKITCHDKHDWSIFHWGVASKQVDTVKALAKYSYLLVSSKEVVLDSRKRIFNALLQFVWLRKDLHLDNLKDATLHYEILSRHDLLREDLVIILLDELKKGNEIKGIALIRSKETTIRFLLNKVLKIINTINFFRVPPDLRTPIDEEKLEASLREGFDERCKTLMT